MQFLKAESYKRGVVFSTVLNILSKGINFLNTLIIAYYFGSNVSTDVYFFVLTVVLLVGTTINAIDYLVLIPEAMKLREQEGEKVSQRFINFFIYLYGFIGLILTITALISPVFFYTLFSKFDEQSLRNNYELLFIGSILIVFQLLNNFLSALLSSYKYFTAPLLSWLINGLFAITFTIIFHDKLGIVGTMQGIALGYMFSFVLLVFTLKRFQHWEFSNIGWIRNKKAWINIGLMQVNILPVWLRNYVTLYLLSGLGVGIITSVTVAQQIAAIIDIALVSQVLSVVGIQLNECNSKNDLKKANEIFILTANSLSFLILPSVTLLVFYSHDILSFFFSRKSFDNTALANIELCFKYLIMLAPFTMFNSLCTRLFASFQIIDKTIFFTSVAHISFLIITVLSINVWGLMGYLYSQIAGYCVIILMFYIIMRREFLFIKSEVTFSFALKQTILNVLIAGAFWQLNNTLFFLSGIVLLTIAIPLQFLVIIVVNYRSPFMIKFKDEIYELSNKIVR